MTRNQHDIIKMIGDAGAGGLDRSELNSIFSARGSGYWSSYANASITMRQIDHLIVREWGECGKILRLSSAGIRKYESIKSGLIKPSASHRRAPNGGSERASNWLGRGLSVSEVARKAGCSRGAVYYAMSKRVLKSSAGER